MSNSINKTVSFIITDNEIVDNNIKDRVKKEDLAAHNITLRTKIVAAVQYTYFAQKVMEEWIDWKMASRLPVVVAGCRDRYDPCDHSELFEILLEKSLDHEVKGIFTAYLDKIYDYRWFMDRLMLEKCHVDYKVDDREPPSNLKITKLIDKVIISTYDNPDKGMTHTDYTTKSLNWIKEGDTVNITLPNYKEKE